MAERLESEYDEVAGMYHSLWGDWYLPAAKPALEKLFFAVVPHGSRLLDVCCGSGHVTRELVARGYHVTGVDNSAELIALASDELPAARFEVQDVRQLRFDEANFDAALSTFDSLNHLLSLEEVRQAFEGVQAALRPGGRFLFDMNLEEAYTSDLSQWAVTADESAVTLVRGVFDPVQNKATTQLIWFTREDGGDSWRRRTSSVRQRCYKQEDLILTLKETGFRSIETTPATLAGMAADLAFGRMFFSALKG